MRMLIPSQHWNWRQAQPLTYKQLGRRSCAGARDGWPSGKAECNALWVANWSEDELRRALYEPEEPESVRLAQTLCVKKGSSSARNRADTDPKSPKGSDPFSLGGKSFSDATLCKQQPNDCWSAGVFRGSAVGRARPRPHGPMLGDAVWEETFVAAGGGQGGARRRPGRMLFGLVMLSRGNRKLSGQTVSHCS